MKSDAFLDPKGKSCRCIREICDTICCGGPGSSRFPLAPLAGTIEHNRACEIDVICWLRVGLPKDPGIFRRCLVVEVADVSTDCGDAGLKFSVNAIRGMSRKLALAGSALILLDERNLSK